MRAGRAAARAVCLAWLVTGCNSEPGESSGDGGPSAEATVPDDPLVQVAWGEVVVNLGEIAASATGLNLEVSAPDRRDLDRVLEYRAASSRRDPDAAHVRVVFGCAAPGLVSVEVASCPSERAPRLPPARGCVEVRFSGAGIAGAFVHPEGLGCEIGGGRAVISMPGRRGFAAERDEAIAVGAFDVACRAADGTALNLAGAFSLPAIAEVPECDPGAAR